MISLTRLAAAWTAAWNAFALPLPTRSADEDNADDTPRNPDLDVEERRLRVLMSHWF